MIEKARRSVAAGRLDGRRGESSVPIKAGGKSAAVLLRARGRREHFGVSRSRQYMDEDQPFYGIQAVGLDGSDRG